VFTAVKADLEAVGITVNETAKDWNGGYLDGVDGHLAELYLLGWTGDYNTPDNFIGTFFTRTDNRFNTAAVPWGAQLSADLQAADAIPDPAQRNEAYVKLNQQIMENLPGVPISHSPPAIVVAGNVDGLVASPLTDERFSTVYKTG
jgi:peptide/nickel transport system substrate-binding protein